MEKKIKNRADYDSAKARLEMLIAEATEKGLLEPEMDNEYTREIGSIGSVMADYEDEYLNIMPLREKSPLIRCIEDYFYSHNMRRKEGAQYLEINESAFSQIMNGKRRISMSLAKRLYSKMGIDANTILEFA